MGKLPPDSVKRLVDARDMTEMSDISDRVPSPTDRKIFLSTDYKEEQLRAAGPVVRRSSFGVRTFLGPVIHEESIKACPELGRKVAGSTKVPVADVAMKRFAARRLHP